MTFRNTCFALAAVLVGACVAQAGTVQLNMSHSAPAGTPAGFTVNDLTVNFTDSASPPSIRGQQLIVTLTSGSVFQQQFGSDTAPNPALFGVAADLPFDTFVTMGGLTSTSASPVLVVGGAVDLQPGAVKLFDTTGINVAWAPGTGVDIAPINNFPTARITLSNNANGTWQYFGSTADGTTKILSSLKIINGVMIPEPTSVTLLGLASIGLIGFIRRRK